MIHFCTNQKMTVAKTTMSPVIALMTIVVIAVTRGRLERKQRRMCAHS